MTDQTRYRIVCGDGGYRQFPAEHDSEAEAKAWASIFDTEDPLPCGPHTVEPVEPVEPVAPEQAR